MVRHLWYCRGRTSTKGAVDGERRPCLPEGHELRALRLEGVPQATARGAARPDGRGGGRRREGRTLGRLEGLADVVAPRPRRRTVPDAEHPGALRRDPGGQV